jgi:hypothetical protein
MEASVYPHYLFDGRLPLGPAHPKEFVFPRVGGRNQAADGQAEGNAHQGGDDRDARHAFTIVHVVLGRGQDRRADQQAADGESGQHAFAQVGGPVHHPYGMDVVEGQGFHLNPPIRGREQDHPIAGLEPGQLAENHVPIGRDDLDFRELPGFPGSRRAGRRLRGGRVRAGAAQREEGQGRQGRRDALIHVGPP